MNTPDFSGNAKHLTSSIKFGSVDTINIKSKHDNMFIYRTKNKTTWNLSLKAFKLEDDPIGEDSEISFEPQLPYIYLP